MVTRAVLSVQTSIDCVGVVFGVVHLARMGDFSEPGGRKEAGGEEDVVEEEMAIVRAGDEIVKDGSVALGQRHVVLGMIEDLFGLESGTDENIGDVVGEIILLEVVEPRPIIEVTQDNYGKAASWLSLASR